MTFLAPLALLLVLLVAGPVVAHLLHRGSVPTVRFAATRFIPATEHLARERNRVSDRALLVVRSLMVATLALLGATPLLRCDTKLLGRSDGASVARIIVIDDSGSMQASLSNGRSRFEQAKAAALGLVEQMQQGDSIGVVLASRPARMKLFPSATLEVVKASIRSLQGTCRPTDLDSAIALSNEVLARQPQTDKKVLLLSDLAGGTIPQEGNIISVMPELSQPIRDCGLLQGLVEHDSITVEFACSPAQPKTTLSVTVLEAEDSNKPLAKATFISESRGRFTFVSELSREAIERGRFVRLVDRDDNPANDTAPLVTEQFRLAVGVYADPVSGSAQTGGPPLTEQALGAINPSWRVQPLSTVPDDLTQLASLSVLFLDNPPPLTAEARSTIDAFVSRGNFAIALFGPACSTDQLSSVHLPFLEQRAAWQRSAAKGLIPFSVNSPIATTTSLSSLNAKGRFVFDELAHPNVSVLARWDDQVPFWIERTHGRGSLSVLGLPSSTALSDFALRPGFLAILDSLVAQAERRGKARVLTAGTSWHLTLDDNVRVLGPDKNSVTYETSLASSLTSNDARDSMDKKNAVKRVTPERVGRYVLEQGGEREERLALFPAEEILSSPREMPVAATNQPKAAANKLDLTRYLVVLLLLLMGTELLLHGSLPERLSRLLRTGRKRSMPAIQ